MNSKEDKIKYLKTLAAAWQRTAESVRSVGFDETDELLSFAFNEKVGKISILSFVTYTNKRLRASRLSLATQMQSAFLNMRYSVRVHAETAPAPDPVPVQARPRDPTTYPDLPMEVILAANKRNDAFTESRKAREELSKTLTPYAGETFNLEGHLLKVCGTMDKLYLWRVPPRKKTS